jgi:hypothetical protein
VIVNDLNIVGVGSFPAKADSPLIIDPNAVLPLSIAAELLKTIPRRNAQIVEHFGRVERHQLSEHEAPQISRKSSDRLAFKESLSVAITKGLDHRL